jgi:hypothetical protein
MSKEFNDWWNADSLVEINPFLKDSPAYWAWEGWNAAMEVGIKEGMKREHAMWVLANIEDVHAANMLAERVHKTEKNEHEPEELARLEQAMIEAWKPIPKREWVGLTNEEILEEYRQSYGDDGGLTDVYFAHAIEAKLKDKNT